MLLIKGGYASDRFVCYSVWMFPCSVKWMSVNVLLLQSYMLCVNSQCLTLSLYNQSEVTCQLIQCT